AFPCGSVGPAEITPFPDDSNAIAVPPSLSRGIVDTLDWQTVRTVNPEPASAFAPVPSLSRYCRNPLARSVRSIPSANGPASFQVFPWSTEIDTGHVALP